jgi:hypothetical protein
MERIARSQQERDRLEWLKKARDGLVTQRAAAEKMGVSDRWVRELLREMKVRGDAVVVHGLTGKVSNRKIKAETQSQVIGILKQPDWHDFGPSFASEQLAKRHDIHVSDETLRKWMIGGGLWKPGSRKARPAHVWRPRRSGFGELTQWDTSDHDWLEGRGPVKHLVRLIDDATSQSWGRFVERDATPYNMGVLWEYLNRHGRMVDVYTDRDSMFTSTAQQAKQRKGGESLTQIGRALRELGIGWIAAYSPQAKGRVERSFQTDQDRLVKQLRLAGIRTLEAANAFLEAEYWPEWNTKFARPAAEFPNLHRAVTEHLDVAAILSHVEQRVVENDYTFSFAGRRYQIARTEALAGMRRKRVRVELRLDGELKARYEGRYLNITPCGARIPVPVVVSRKPVRKDHNAGGRSNWMDGFFDRPSPALWSAIRG